MTQIKNDPYYHIHVCSRCGDEWEGDDPTCFEVKGLKQGDRDVIARCPDCIAEFESLPLFCA